MIWPWSKIKRLEAELERERMCLAACGVAALGYFDGCHPDYDSASLQDVLKLRAESVPQGGLEHG